MLSPVGIVNPPEPKKRAIGPIILQLTGNKNGAGNETRTRDSYLGKVVLYQLSYARSEGYAEIITNRAFVKFIFQ
jgi:hypothetical protein